MPTMSPASQASTMRAPLAASPTVFPFLCIALFLIYLDATIVTVALPTIQSRLGAQLNELQWLVNCYTLALASLLLTAGSLADRFGKRRMLLIGIAGFLLASVACALTESLPLLLAARAAQGVFAALLVPPTLGSLPGLFPDPAARARAIGRIAAVVSLATATGPVVGGWLLGHFGWQSIFWVNVPLAAIAWLGVCLLMPADMPQPRRALDLPGQLLLMATLGLLTFSLTETPSLGWSAPLLRAAGIGTILCAIAFAIWERQAPDPIWPGELFRDRVILIACASNFLGLTGFFVVQFVLVFWYQDLRGETALAAGSQLLWLTVALIIASPLSGRWIATRGARPAMLAGTAACALGLLVLAGLGFGLPAPVVPAGLILMGAGLAAIAASGTTAILLRVAPERVSMATGTASSLRQLGGAFGIGLAGTALAVAGASATTPAIGFAQGAAIAFSIAAGCSAILCLWVWYGYWPERR